ncbi:FMN-binding negative transcriptional regulator [Streptomyces sp. NPDC059002]|uniref:FMN-binding negative transcriptional regulator n=1 Tax=Streptomyces sp. NPDC059002 TaxID=3346690 RepID=UPI0036A4C9DD
MLVPKLYEPSSQEQIRAVVSGYPLALLVTNGPQVPFATNLPVVTADDSNDADLVGRTLFGHMNRTNAHWSALTDGMAGKLVFNGPGAYVSPVAYETSPAAPTWDFVTVHLYGRIQPLPAGEDTLAVVRRTAAMLEDEFGRGWDQTDSVEYFRSIVAGVGAFEFVVAKAEAMFKLSQEKSPEIQQRLIDRFADRAGPHRALGCTMRDFGLGTAENN